MQRKSSKKSDCIKPVSAGVTFPLGFVAAAAKAGIKSSGSLDAGIIKSQFSCTSAGTFTTNRVRASCVRWCEKILPASGICAVFCNAGNANACTGKRGDNDTRLIAAEVAKLYHGRPGSVLVAATGVIGHFLPMDKVLPCIPDIAEKLSVKGGDDFARAIMTTDTKKKECACEVALSSGKVRIGGCTKGSGMIHPNMATMLCFITTDAKIRAKALDSIVRRVVDGTYNNLTVDGDTSTNDMVLVLANGASGVSVSDAADAAAFEDALFYVCSTLCKKIAEDGEGATKRVEINVTGAATYSEAKLAAKAVANSSLVKTALFGNDPNWGRIACAIGYSGARFSEERIMIKLCGKTVFRAMRPMNFDAKSLSRKISGKVIGIDIDLGLGKYSATAHTCDLTYDYVKINAEYHT
jgi:glutamate N-acetyltransferase / amino-acid N-acetyltransferase